MCFGIYMVGRLGCKYYYGNRLGVCRYMGDPLIVKVEGPWFQCSSKHYYLNTFNYNRDEVPAVVRC